MLDMTHPTEAGFPQNPIESLRAAIAFSNRDWSLDPQDAWVYGIVLGWSEDALEELRERFGWTDSTVERLRNLRRASDLLSTEPGGEDEYVSLEAYTRQHSDRGDS